MAIETTTEVKEKSLNFVEEVIEEAIALKSEKEFFFPAEPPKNRLHPQFFPTLETYPGMRRPQRKSRLFA